VAVDKVDPETKEFRDMYEKEKKKVVACGIQIRKK
jgi:hypothetical protein